MEVFRVFCKVNIIFGGPMQNKLKAKEALRGTRW